MLGRLFLVFMLFSCSSCYSQENMGLIKNWHSYPVQTKDDSIVKYNYSPKEWTVSIKNGEVFVAEKKENGTIGNLPFKVQVNEEDKINAIGDVCYLKVDDGFLVGFNRGEWGGSLYWFATDGKKHYKISNDEVVQFIQRDSHNYAIQGLYHMGLSEGSIISIEKKNGKWKASSYLALPKAPEAITLDNLGNFYIATSNSILKIDKIPQKYTLIEDGIWAYGLYVNSIVAKDDVLYIGMHGAVYKYDVKDGKQAWLLNY